MADGVRLLHQLRRLAEVGVRPWHRPVRRFRPGGRSTPKTPPPPGLRSAGKDFACQRGLIHLHRVAGKQARIRRHNIAQSQADDVAWHHLARRRGDPLSITLHPGLDRQFGLQGSDGVARLVFFPESDDGVGNQQEEDDEEIRPVPDRTRQNHRYFDHPWDGTPKIAEEFQERVGFPFFDLVRPILGQPFLRLGLSEPVRRRP